MVAKAFRAIVVEQYVTASPPEAVASLAAEPKRIASGSVYNDGLAAAYVQFHDLKAAPTGGETPVAVLGVVGAGETFQIPCEVAGEVGAQLALSSTGATFTAYVHGHFLIWTVAA